MAPAANLEPHMNAFLLLLTESLACIAVSFAVLYVLSRPLMDVLTRLCPDEQAASFWLAYTKMMLIISPLLLVLTVDMFTHFANPLDSLRLALMATLAGLLFGLYSVGKRLSQFMAKAQQPGSAA